MFLEAERTPYDLNWRMFGTPVRVNPWFWLVSAMFGWDYGQVWGFQYLLVWIVCVFVSILVHEFGHVLSGRIFGSFGSIVLYSFGGLAIGSSELANRWQRVAVYFAGPLAGFILYGVIKLSSLGMPGWRFEPSLFEAAVFFLVSINLFWGIFNLMPVWPLDGGQISKELFNHFMPGRGTRVALGVSAGVAATLALLALIQVLNKDFLTFLPFGRVYTVLFFGLLAFNSYQLMQQTSPQRQRSYEDEERAPWERDPDYWKR